ncbi:MAG: AI-2E family transporter [Oscillospiraceae bacterium]|nr:AI-2E family transporter [Oscillospiraceae bacterium]
MKIDWNRKYTTIAAYAFLVIAAAMLFYAAMTHFAVIRDFWNGLVTIMLPMIYGFSIAYVLNPVMRFFEDKLLTRLFGDKISTGVRRVAALLLTYFCSVAVITVFISIVAPQVASSVSGIVSNISSYIPAATAWLDGLLSRLPSDPYVQELLTKATQSMEKLLEMFYSWVSSSLPYLLNVTKSLTVGVTNSVLGVIISIYLLMGKERLFAQTKKALYAFLPVHTVDRLVSVTHTSNQVFSSFITGKLLDSLIIGILCFISMSVFRMPMAMLVSVIVGVTNVIPYFGPFIGAIPSALIIFLVSPAKAFWFLILILVLQQFDGNILGPKILGESIGISALWVIFAILFFGGYFGVLGMFVGVPTFAVLYSLFRTAVELRLEKRGLPVETGEYASLRHPLLKKRQGKTSPNLNRP